MRAGNDDNAPFDPLAAIERNRERLRARFAAADRSRVRWLVECRDLGDAFEADAGVFFSECADDAAVDALAARFTEEHPANRILGIFDLARPLEEQKGGLTRDEWLQRRR